MGNKIRLTKKSVEAIPTPAKGRTFAYDDATPGLAVQVTPAGRRAFYWYKWTDGKPSKLKIGDYPAWTITQARDKVATLQGEVAKGHDPVEDRRNKRAEITFGEAFKHYLEHHAKRHKRTWAEDEQKYNLHLADWKGRRLSTIRRADVQAKITEIGTTQKTDADGKTEVRPRPGAANRLLALLSTIFNVVIHDLDLSIKNPAAGVRKFPEHQRHRYLKADELARFYESLRLEPDSRMRHLFELALLTGQRRGAICAMEWSELDLEAGVWLVPEAKQKGKRETAIPLVPRAVDVLRERQTENEHRDEPHPYVFPNKRREGKSPHIVTTRLAWLRLTKRAGLEGVRLHDLRHTAASWMTATGAPLQVVSKALAHRSTKTTEIYSHLELEPIRAAMLIATDAMDRASRASSLKNNKGGE